MFLKQILNSHLCILSVGAALLSYLGNKREKDIILNKMVISEVTLESIFLKDYCFS